MGGTYVLCVLAGHVCDLVMLLKGSTVWPMAGGALQGTAEVVGYIPIPT